MLSLFFSKAQQFSDLLVRIQQLVSLEVLKENEHHPGERNTTLNEWCRWTINTVILLSPYCHQIFKGWKSILDEHLYFSESVVICHSSIHMKVLSSYQRYYFSQSCRNKYFCLFMLQVNDVNRSKQINVRLLISVYINWYWYLLNIYLLHPLHETQSNKNYACRSGQKSQTQNLKAMRGWGEVE